MIIYRIINSINNKVYIGETTQALSLRFSAHKASKKGCTKLIRAFDRHGRDNFSIEQIDTASSISELAEKEQFWIKHYNSVKNGYNCSPGRAYSKMKNTPILRSIVIYNITTETETVFASFAEAGRFLGCNPPRLFDAVKKKKRYKNFYIRFVGDVFELPPQKVYPNSKAVIGVNIKLQEVVVYTNLNKAQDDGFIGHHISRACRGKNNNYYRDFKWSFLDQALLKLLNKPTNSTP